MAVFQITMKMGWDRWGWTYSFTTTTGYDDPNAYSISNSLLIASQNLHHLGVTFHGYEIRNLEKPRLAIPKEVNGVSVGGQEPAPASASIKVLIRGENGANRFIQLRGLQSNWVKVALVNGAPNLPNTAITAVNNFIQGLVDSGAQIRQVVGTDVNPTSNITAIRLSTFVPGYTEFQSTPVGGFDAGMRIRISGVDPCVIGGLNGDWTVMAENGTATVIPKTWRLSPTEVIEPTDAKVRLLEWEQRAITGWNIHSVGSRDTGRPTKLSRGRQRGVSCRL